MRNLLRQSDAWKEYESLQADKASLKEVNKLLKDVMRNGYQCSYGKAESA
jgi:Txe/YoeB family toxin of Txe-Axe toxin-antitoxin module